MTDNTPAMTGGVHPLKRAAARRGINVNVDPAADGRVAVSFRRRGDATRFRAATGDLDGVHGARWYTDPWPFSWAKWATWVTVPADHVPHLLDTLTAGGDR